MNVFLKMVLAILDEVFENDRQRTGSKGPAPGAPQGSDLAEMMREYKRQQELLAQEKKAAKNQGPSERPAARPAQASSPNKNKRAQQAPPPLPGKVLAQDRLEPVHSTVHGSSSQVHGIKSKLKGHKSELGHGLQIELGVEASPRSLEQPGQSLAQVLNGANHSPLKQLLIAQVVLGPCKAKQPHHHSPFQ